MEDSVHFPKAFIKAINSQEFDGESMIATSRAILRNSYSDIDYKNEFFSIFILIDEETGDVVLKGFGEFNVASERYNIGKNYFASALRILSRKRNNSTPRSNSTLYKDDIDNIAHLYHHQFLSSLRDFKQHFGLR